MSNDELRDLSNRYRGDRPRGPERNYRPGTSAFDEEQRRGLPWQANDIIGAIGLSITVGAVVLFAGAAVDEIIPSSESSPLGEIIALIIAASLSYGIVNATKLPIAASIIFVGLGALANIAVHFVSGGGESELLGLSARFMETAIVSAVPFGTAWLYVVLKHDRSLRDLGLIAPASPKAYLIALGAWFVAFVGAGIWVQLVHDVESISPPDTATSLLELAGGSLIVAWLLIGLWGPVAEEIFFRGFLIGGLYSRFGKWPTLLISSGIFALFHIHPGLYVPTFLAGLALGWVYLKTRSVWPSISVHLLQNTIALISVSQDVG